MYEPSTLKAWIKQTGYLSLNKYLKWYLWYKESGLWTSCSLYGCSYIIVCQVLTRVNLLWNRINQFQNKSKPAAVMYIYYTLNQQHHALLWVDYVIREQSMLDVFTMLEIYLHFLTENISLIEKNSDCPDELKEATSTLIFASSRCREFPELLYMREMLYTKFGKEYATRAVEQHSNSCVNPMMIQKLSTREPNLEIRLKLLKAIASENGILLHLEDVGQATPQEKVEKDQKQEHCQDTHRSPKLTDHKKGGDTHNLHAEVEMEDKPSELVTASNKNKKINAAEQEAFQSAAYAAEETAKPFLLSTEESQDTVSDTEDQSSCDDKIQHSRDSKGLSRPKTEVRENTALNGTKPSHSRFDFQRIHPITNYSSGTNEQPADAEKLKNELPWKQVAGIKGKAGLESTPSASRRGLHTGTSIEGKPYPELSNEGELLGNRGRMEMFYSKDQDNDRIKWEKHDNLQSNSKTNLITSGTQPVSMHNVNNEETHPHGNKNQLPYQSHKRILLDSRVVPSVNPLKEESRVAISHRSDIVEWHQPKYPNAERKGLSVRTRRAEG